MSARSRRPRPRRRASRLLGFGAEGLEARRLLVATPINVAAGLTLAIASPLPGLASTAGPISPSQAIATTSATVAPVSATSAGPAANNIAMATGPATTLSALANDSETANATASEVARPRPGLSDRVQSAIPEAETTPAPKVEAPTPVEVIPGPELQAPPAPLPTVEPTPAEPVAPAPTDAAPAPAPVPELAPLPDAPDLGFAAWDVALDLVSTDQPEETEAPPTVGSVAVAAGVVVVAWGGWHLSPRSKGRSQRTPVVVNDRVAGPGKLPAA